MRATISVNNSTQNYQIEIRLNDECKNGHEDFAITATFWTPRKPRIDRFCETAGCCHDEILAVRPDLAPFVNLHLCDFNGAPMYAVGNGLYYAKPGQYHDKNAGPQSLARYFRISENVAAELCAAEDKTHFAFLIEKAGIPKLWKREAAAAIRLLEKMTGEKFVSHATRSHYTPLEKEERKAFVKLFKTGYYSPEKVQERAKQARQDKINKMVQQREKQLEAELEKETTKAKVDIALLKAFPEKEKNWFYYHTDKSIKFNSSRLSMEFSNAEISAALEILRAIVPEIEHKPEKL